MAYLFLEDMIPATAEAVRPVERLTVSQSAERYRWLNNPGSYVGYWKNSKTPYLVEPMDEMTSLDYTGLVFVGPARTGKTDMFFNWLTHTALTDPADMMMVHMTQNTARDWSQGDLNKAFFLEGNKKRPTGLGERLVPGRQNDNVHDKKFLSGMRLLIKWPTITELSGKTIPRLWINDYDRMDQNVDGEGNPFDLTRKRAQTFKRYGMCVAEASPGFPITDPKWINKTPHEAPPTEGLLAIYNRGDRRRWYWRCLQCREAFEPDFKLLVYPDSNDFMDAAEQVSLPCPSCGFPHLPKMQAELNELDRNAKWIKEGQFWLPDGSVVGTARRSDIASFWLKGPAAAFTDWPALVHKYLLAEDEFERTGSEESLKTTINVDQGLPYTPKAMEAGRLPEHLKARAKPYSSKGEVPEGVRFLVTTIDVQAGARPSFVCHTYGIGPGATAEDIESGKIPTAADIWHVDMWKIRKSNRLDEDQERKVIDPAAYPEDWDVLIDDVIEKTYPLADGSGRHMQVKLVACDSGGAAATTKSKKKNKQAAGEPIVSVTSNAYAFWRRLRDDEQGRNYHLRFHLLKGQPSNTAPRLMKTLPDSQQKDKYAIARGDVPVWLVNSNQVKDQTSAKLGRTEPGGQIHFPQWFDENGEQIDIDWLYTQLTTEIRLPVGWENPSRRKNEAWDLLCYCVAFVDKHPDLRIEHMNWADPPGWARDWDANDMVFLPEEGMPFAPQPAEEGLSLADLARNLA